MTPFRALDAAAVPIRNPNLDTDQIIPARFLSRPRGEGIGDCLFRDLRFTADGAERPGFPLHRPEWREARIVVGERNFGCGSSRENAVWALHDYGIRAVVAPSFGDIFANNCLKNGVLPVRLPEPVVADVLAQIEADPGAQIAICLDTQILIAPDGGRHTFEIDPFSRHCLLNGIDELGHTLDLAEQISAFEHRYGRENT